ncbi:hypothetical protein OAF51_04850 [Akkermansiaceae bacterium]|nr:hypothetical protein [Akkermansiaceae bacterium]
MDLEEQANIMGGLQRQRSNQELAELNQQLREMKAAEEAAPKCPYCAGPIAKEVSKCRHCASDIEWATWAGITIPCKSGQSAQIVAQLKAEKEQEIEGDEKVIRAITEKFPKCKKCGELNSPRTIWEARKIFDFGGLCIKCIQKKLNPGAFLVFGKSVVSFIIYFFVVAVILGFLFTFVFI